VALCGLHLWLIWGSDTAADILPAPVHANGFDLSNTSIPRTDILRGGPAKDGIPAILEPKFISPSEAEYLRPDDEVIGFGSGEHARAYPLRILLSHEIVNDTVEGVPIAVTYCPLCGTCMVFDRRVDGRELTFGVSGLLYHSDVLMYDHQSESLWSQLKMEGISARYKGQRLAWLPSEQLTWSGWQLRYPQGKVLSTDTGFRRHYEFHRNPYSRYEKSEKLMFPVPNHRLELRKKAWVVGIVIDGISKAYPVEVLEKLTERRLVDKLGPEQLTITYDADSRHVEVLDRDGNAVPSVRAYWFAWQAFYPETLLFTPAS
jgi:hypothetical protein